jgi:hypothetical protein
MASLSRSTIGQLQKVHDTVYQSFGSQRHRAAHLTAVARPVLKRPDPRV